MERTGPDRTTVWVGLRLFLLKLSKPLKTSLDSSSKRIAVSLCIFVFVLFGFVCLL